MRANCPSCGAELTLRFSSVVCRQCRTVAARASDQNVRAVGQAALFQSQSSLSVGMQGELNQTFTLVGHVQFQHPAGGVWDEWYAVFADGHFGWLAEAQGKFFMTSSGAAQRELPSFDSFFPGQQVTLPASASSDASERYTVNEKGVARVLAAEGDIPFVLHPGEPCQFVDLSGPSGEFATINYREATVFDSAGSDAMSDYRQAPASSTTLRPYLYVGREFSLAELSLTANPSAAPSAAFTCPSCGGSLALQAPGSSARVACPSCGNISELERGQTQSVGQSPRSSTLELPLGTTARFEGQQLVIIGYLRRSALFDGERFGWEEYLLYHKELGFRWLVKGEKGWSYVKPLNPGEVRDSVGSTSYNGTNFRLDETCRARVDLVVGEFYWKVSVGEEVEVADYQNSNQSLSKESSRDEVNWSHGVYLSASSVELATGLTLASVQPSALYTDYSDSESTPGSSNSEAIAWVVIIIVIVFLMIVMDSCDGSGGSSGGTFFGGFRGGK
jgi:Domain of unknown function (DUF4178)